jgi:DNA-directed RNA polymerase sigma subunit (sigma70/sigma32)
MMDELFKLYQQTLPVHVPAHTLRKLCWRTGNQRSEELNEIHEKIAKPLQLQRIYDDSNSDDVFLKRKAFDADVDSTAEYFDKYLLPEDVQFIINKLPDNVKRAFWMRTGLDMGGRYTIEEIAEELNVPQKIAQNFINKAVKYLRKEPVIQKIKKKEAFN